MPDYEIFEIPGFTTQSGVTFNATIAYKTYGELNAARDNVVVLPCFYGGRHTEVEYFLNDGRALDINKYFVVVPNLFCNGYSSSPSNTDGAYGRAAFPEISLYDNVTAHYRLLSEHLSIEHVRLVVGFSMGGQQAFQWGALYPDYVDAIIPICGSAKTSEHNKVMLDGPTSALRTDAAFNDGWYEDVPMKGMLAFGRVYTGWLYSQTFFRDELYRSIGLDSADDVVRMTQSYFLLSDANNLLATASTWRRADVSANDTFGGDLQAALGAIRARAIVMPATTDLYFRVADNEREVAAMPNAELRPIQSDWGHAAGFGMNPADDQFIDDAIKEVLE